MTKLAPCTEAHVRRLIRAAKREGLHVVGIKPDGTLLVQCDNVPLAPLLDGNNEADIEWGNVEA